MEVEVRRSHKNRYGTQLEAFTINALINKEIPDSGTIMTGLIAIQWVGFFSSDRNFSLASIPNICYILDSSFFLS